MLKKFFVILLMIYFCTITVFAQDDDRTASVIVYEYDQDLFYEFMEVPLQGKNMHENVQQLFTSLTTLDYNENQIPLIPEGSLIEKVWYVEEEGHLKVSFNECLLEYGGSTYEIYLINQLLFSFFSLKDVKIISFYINDVETIFKEGTSILNYTKDQFVERMRDSEAY